MTMRTRTWLLCSCGHRGAIVESENDQPYSASWSSNDLLDLENKGQYRGSDALFLATRPSCPKCGATLTPENIVQI